ncbi:MAG TPA: winged helix-turn-helix domain-containing protein [Thermoplasmata archaeon]|nr:winged helix-turn-helix domain-containing protein [Thermoplasmata archaeon]
MGEEVAPGTDPPTASRVSWQEAILRALGDPLSRQILLLLGDAPKPARDLLAVVSVPQSTLYRRLGELKAMGLLDVQRSVISEDGKKIELYRSLLEEVEIRLRGQILEVRPRRRDLAAARLTDLWSEVRERRSG